MQLQNYILFLQDGKWNECMSSLTDKYVISSFDGQFSKIRKAKNVKNFIYSKLVYGHCLICCWLTDEWHIDLANCLSYHSSVFNNWSQEPKWEIKAGGFLPFFLLFKLSKIRRICARGIGTIISRCSYNMVLT